MGLLNTLQELRPARGPRSTHAGHGRGRPVRRPARAEHAAGRGRSAIAAAEAALPPAVGGELLLDAEERETTGLLLAFGGAVGVRLR